VSGGGLTSPFTGGRLLLKNDEAKSRILGGIWERLVANFWSLWLS